MRKVGVRGRVLRRRRAARWSHWSYVPGLKLVRRLLVLAIIGLPFTGSPAAARSLFVGRTCDLPPIAELTALGHFNSFTDFDVSSATPTLTQLQGYDAVLIYTNCPPQNPTALGDVLADLVDSGGYLVVGTYSFSTPWAVQGRIATASYAPLVNQSINGDVSGQFRAVVPGDAIFTFPNTITPAALSYFHNSNFAHPGVAAGALVLADDNAGVPLFAVNAAGNVGALNMFAGGGNFGGNNAEFYQFLENALVRVSVCGNGALDPGEQCDDANHVAGDGCDSCRVEACYTCTGAGPGSCTPSPSGTTCPDDGNTCTDDRCNATGTCTHSAVANNTPCNDNNLCTQTDTCQAGTCTGGNPALCPGEDACNYGPTVCQPTSGLCAACPTGYTPGGGGCQKIYSIDVSLLDNFPNDCGNGNRYNDCSGAFGFHWTDVAGATVGSLLSVDIQFTSGVECDGTHTVSLNGNSVGTYTPPPACTCSPPQTPQSLLSVNTSSYVRGGLNAVSITATTCAGLFAPAGVFATITTTYAQLSGPKPALTPCGDPSDTACDHPDSCNNTGSCLPNYQALGSPCTPAGGGTGQCSGSGACNRDLHPPDRDRDGIVDDLDNCPDNANADQQDADSDGVGDACDNCPNDFNAFQTDVCGTGKDSATASSPALSLQRVRLVAAPNGSVRITGTLDTTDYGGLDGFVGALHTRQPTDASTASTDFRQGDVFAFNVSGAGLTAPGQSMWFPACPSVARCVGTNGESVSFVRKGATNLFTVRLTARGGTFPPPLSSATVAVTLSLDGSDDVDQANCRTFGGKGKTATCRK